MERSPQKFDERSRIELFGALSVSQVDCLDNRPKPVLLPPTWRMPTSAATAQTLLISAQYPFAISFLVWGLLYAYRERNSRYEEKLASMFSSGHGFGVGTLCLLSICGRVDETWTIAFTWAYFALDTWKMWRQKEWLFVLHHMLTLGSLVLTLGSTIMLEHRLSSYMLLIEWSAIPLNIWWEDKGNATKYKVLVGGYPCGGHMRASVSLFPSAL